MEPKITTYLFDCFGVLCTPILSTWYEQNSAKYSFVDEDLPNILRKLDLNQMTEDELFEYFAKYPNVQATKDQVREEVDALLTLNADTFSIVKDLKQKGNKVGVLSNANNSFFERMIYVKYPEFKELFDEVFVSSVIGMAKPDTSIFDYALKKMNVSPQEVLFIDDTKVNITAAEELGIHAYLYTDADSLAGYITTLA